ncbi:M48 family metalloprotease [Halorussus amylolyticus]|uniref:M48 family metalloprotease n=1 Tax=Halorussus amylolyticus TaxID=1126242 RepID=UPI00104AECAF|nr:M48 family metalloprotease [Halorussus amylolyticus]
MTSNTDLTRRVAATLALVLVADALLVAVVAYLLAPWVVPFVGTDPGVVGWAALVVPATAALAWAQLEYARRETLAAAGARTVSDSEYPDLSARLRRLSQAAGVRTPALAIADTEVPNSLTVGGPRSATVVVSTGLLDALSEDELDAVLAHELAHLRNRDATVMTLATFLPALASEESSLASAFGGSAARRLALGVAAVVGYAASTSLVSAPPFSLESLLAFGGFAAFTLVFGGVALGLLATPVVVLSGRLSRYREFGADRAGAVLSGDPAAMASALETLDDETADRPETDFRAAGVRELCFLPHGIGGDETNSDDPLADLPLDVATHPPTEERIARLRELQAEGSDVYE